MSDQYDYPKKPRSFAKKYPLLTAILAIAAITFVGLVASLWFLDLWTHHGATSKVPEVKGMSLHAAANVLDGADLEYVISDSIYSDSIRGGTVAEVWPKPGAVVKAGREVYLTIVAFNPRMVIIEKPLTDISDQQAINYLLSLGFNESQIQRQYVDGENDNEVLGATVNGQYVTLGSRIPVNSTVVLQVSRIPVQEEDFLQDGIDAAVDSIMDVEPYE